MRVFGRSHVTTCLTNASAKADDLQIAKAKPSLLPRRITPFLVLCLLWPCQVIALEQQPKSKTSAFVSTKIIESLGRQSDIRPFQLVPGYPSIGRSLVRLDRQQATQSINSDFNCAIEPSATHLHHLAAFSISSTD